MILRAIVLLFAVIALAGCPKPERDPNKAKGKNRKDSQQPELKDQSTDAAFQAFLGRLRKAIELRDKAAMAPMMAEGFGYRWDKGPDDETPFSYWDRNNLWGELAALVKERWVPHAGFMVVPAQFAASDSYAGFRAGMTLINGSWRFAYFVPAPPPTSGPPSPQ
jgi:hypothetical protein